MNETNGSPIRLEVRNDVAYITLDSPPLNIMTMAMMDAVTEALGTVTADSSIKAVAFTANGKAFSAGADVDEHRPEKINDMIASFGGMFRALSDLEVPCVMAVNGPALGGGFELAMMADILLASEKATFGQPEIRLGFFAPVGVVVLPARIGPGRAMEITCSGRTYSASDMSTFGLVSRVVPPEELEGALESTLKDFRHASPLVMRLNVRTLKGIFGVSHFKEALAMSEKAFLEELMVTEDVREGITSFFEKRKPIWKNR
jgi:cyclohexa-1,5-dienecarbonyl-CoA hydratase